MARARGRPSPPRRRSATKRHGWALAQRVVYRRRAVSIVSGCRQAQTGSGCRQCPGCVRVCVPMPKRILVVDDDPAQRRILEELIKRFGFETKSAGSGAQALHLLDAPDRGAISLVLLDLVMPDLDGLGVLERLAGMPGAPPVIVQTAHGSLDHAISAMR